MANRALSSLVIGLVLLAPATALAATAKAFVIKGDDITAEAQKPEITILISRQNLSPKYVLDLKESFLPKIIESVSLKPF